jgi:hypothetical protein
VAERFEVRIQAALELIEREDLHMERELIPWVRLTSTHLRLVFWFNSRVCAVLRVELFQLS